MSLTRKIAGHTLFYGVAQVIVMVSGIVSMPILTRCLTRTNYGLMSIIGVTIRLGTTVFSGGLRHSLTRFYGEHQAGGRLSESLGTYLTCTLGLGALGTVAAALSFPLLVSAGLLPEWALPAAFLAAPLVFIRVGFAGIACIYRMREQVVRYSVFEIACKYLGMILCIGFVLVVFPSLFQFYRGLFIGETVVLGVLCTCFIREARGLRFGVSRPVAREMFFYGLPLMAGSLASIAYQFGDRFVIKALLDAEQVALYSVGAQLASYTCVAIVSGFEFALVPIVMNAWGSGERDRVEATLSNLVRYYALAAFPIAAGLVAVRLGLIHLVASQKYLLAAPVVPLVVGAAMLQGFQTPLTIGLHFAKRTGVLAMLFAGMAALNIVLNIVLIPVAGIVGAGISTLGCSALYILVGHLLARRHYSIRIPWGSLGRYALAAVVMYAAVVRLELRDWRVELAVRVLSGMVIYVGLVLALDRRLRLYIVERLTGSGNE